MPDTAARYSVRFGAGKAAPFREVAGLPRTKLPGLHKAGNVTLKRGVIAARAAFWAWNTHPAEPKTVVIALLDERGMAAATWKLVNARIVKVEGPSLNGKANDVAIDSIVITHDAVEILGSKPRRKKP